MDMGLNEFPEEIKYKIGQVVRSRKGKDSGRWYVIVAVEKDGRKAYLADGSKFTPERPKPKNTIHLQPTGWHLAEIEKRVLTEGKVDSGRFQVLLSGLIKMNTREVEGNAWQTKTK